MTYQVEKNPSWEQLNYAQKAEEVLDNVDLTSHQRDSVWQEWCKITYGETIEDGYRALIDLQNMAVELVMSDEEKELLNASHEEYKQRILGD